MVFPSALNPFSRAIARMSANWVPSLGDWSFLCSRPPVKAIVSSDRLVVRRSCGGRGHLLQPLDGASAPDAIAFSTEPVTSDPPDMGPSGRLLSPMITSMRSSGTPVFSCSTCAKIVYVPVPMSCVPQRTHSRPLAQNSTVAVHGSRNATQLAPASPQPRILPSRRIEPIPGVRFSHPNFFAPVS